MPGPRPAPREPGEPELARVASRGLPGRAALGLLAVGLVAVVGIALTGRAADGSPVPQAERPGWTTPPTQVPAATPPPFEPAPTPGTPWIEHLVPGGSPTLATGAIVPRDVATGTARGRSAPTGGSLLPDFAGALAGDDGAGPLPLGTIRQAPGGTRLDFLFELCSGGGGCFRDAHWLDPFDNRLGSGTWTAGRAFNVREGFVNEDEEPLGSGFDVVLYVTRVGGWGEPTYRFTSDYVLRGTTDRCGPTYETQTGPATCEWFVHDFPHGLPEGRFAIWAVWEAPCRAWVDLGLATTCDDPDEVVSYFSSGFDAPYDRLPVFDEPRPGPRPATPRPREAR